MSENRWTVTIERDGGNECQVSFTICDGDKPERGYPHDAALVVNLLDWLARYDGSPELEAIAQKAREVFDALCLNWQDHDVTHPHSLDGVQYDAYPEIESEVGR